MPVRGLVTIFSCCIFPAVRFLCVLSALFPWAAELEAQAPAFQSPDAFQQTAQHAGLIFDGTVTAIHSEFAKGKLPQTYFISFRVKQGVRGVRSGGIYSIREWAGLWMPGQKPRYHIGERAMWFLYPPSPAGLTSTVGGRTGKLPILAGAVNGEQVLLPLGWLESLGQPAAASSKRNAYTPAPIPSPAQPDRVPVAWLVQRITQAGLALNGRE